MLKNANAPPIKNRNNRGKIETDDVLRYRYPPPSQSNRNKCLPPLFVATTSVPPPSGLPPSEPPAQLWPWLFPAPSSHYATPIILARSQCAHCVKMISMNPSTARASRILPAPAQWRSSLSV